MGVGRRQHRGGRVAGPRMVDASGAGRAARLLASLLGTALLAGAASAPSLAAPDPPAIPWHRAQEAAAKAAALAARYGASGPWPHVEVLEAPLAVSLPIDATFYDLRLDLDPVTRVVRGDVAIEARVGSASLAAVLLDFDSTLHVDSLRVDGAPATFTHSTDDLTVQLGRTYVPGEPVRIEVLYAGTPSTSGSLHFDTRNGQPVIWTLSEPYGSRTWWPCQDTPADKADSVHVDLTVPANLLAVSNGTLADTINTGGWTTWQWRERYPITPYLVSVAAHPYTPLATTYVPLAGGAMPVTLWSYPDQVQLAQPFLVTTVNVLNRFATLFGEYPFVTEKYDIAQFPWGGGMEHQTATSQCCWSNMLTVHETAHQWFGDAITCETFSDIWLNEGFATYCEALWDEGTGGAAAYRANIMANRFYGNGTIWVPPGSSFGRIFDGNLSYNKASWVLHMLRGVLGDTAFFATLRAYATDPSFAYGTATTADFQSVAETTSGRDLDDFFARWIYAPYYPTYLYDWTAAPEGAGWRLDLAVEQIQTQGLYRMPLGVRVTTGAGTESFVVEDSLQSQGFALAVGAEPLAVTLDPDDWILCTTEPALRNPNFWRGVLVVNGVPWSVGTELTSAYGDSVFSAGYPFSFWDVHAAPTGGYVPQLPPPLGHGTLPPELLQEFSTVVWVGDADLDQWNDASLVSYLRAGGNLLFMGRRGQEYMHPSRSSRLGLRWAESASATLASATAAYPGFVSMARTGTQSGCAVFETSFDHPETMLLLTETQSFSVARGIAAWRRPPHGGTVRSSGGHFAFVSGRPYRWEHPGLRANARTILAQLFGEPLSPTGAAPPAAVTRLFAPSPNPFNPGAAVRWELAREGRVRMQIFDAAGRRVRGLLDAVRPAGPGRIVWDGSDESGHRVASGVYHLRFEADGTARTTKLTVVR